MAYIGIDIGGGSIKSMLFHGGKLGPGKANAFKQSHHFASGSAEEFLSEVYTHIDSFLDRLEEKDSLQAIGLASPGPLSPDREKVLTGIKLRLEILVGSNLGKKLSEKYNVPVFWEKDSNLFALAESTMGAGKGAGSVMGVTIGTGVGAGLAIRRMEGGHPGRNYYVHKGAFGAAGELGHMVINADGRECWCGRQGCLEQYVSEEALRIFQEGLTIDELHRRINLNFDWAHKALKDMGHYMGVGLANATNVVDPDVIVIGGGLVEQHSNMFFTPLEKTMRDKIFSKKAQKSIRATRGKLGYYAGAIGAMIYAHQKQEQELPNFNG